MTTNTRMGLDEYFLKMVRLTSDRGACVRRKTGCILVNDRDHVIATGYNGRASGVTNCIEKPCEGSELDSGLGLERCEAIHAEANALLQCPDVFTIKTTYCTTAPCIHCIKLLMNTSCKRIVFLDDYPHSRISEELWFDSGRVEDDEYINWVRTWEQFTINGEMV